MIDIFNLRKTKSARSYLKYHIIFCTRYRRKLFTDSNLAERVHKIILNTCHEMDVCVISINIGESHIELIIESPPHLSPNQIIYRLKKHCNVAELKDEFPVIEKIPNVWTRGYLVSTEFLDKLTIDKYIQSQKNRQ